MSETEGARTETLRSVPGDKLKRLKVAYAEGLASGEGRTVSAEALLDRFKEERSA